VSAEQGREVGYARLRDAIRLDIVAGAHPAGARLKVPELRARYGVSAIPVREALQALQGEGLVTMQPHRGALVRAVDLEVVRQIYEIREALEGYLAGRFAVIAPVEALAELRITQARMEALERAGDITGRHLADRSLHRAILGASGNDQALSIIERQNDIINALRLSFGQSEARRTQVREEHRALIEAFEARDDAAATRIAALHARNAFQDLTFRMRAAARAERS
jgi:DNA-binding GntR family transcriptional regulator